MCTLLLILSFFFVNDTATTEIYTYLHTLSLHDALPILISSQCPHSTRLIGPPRQMRTASGARIPTTNASDATTPMPLARRYSVKPARDHGSGTFSHRWKPSGCAAYSARRRIRAASR